MSRYLGHDPLSGAVETFDYDESEDLCIVKRTADVQPAIDRNKGYHLHSDGRSGDMRLAASIPVDVALLWLQKYGVSCWKAEHWPAVKRLLEDPDWKHLRPTSFRL